MCTAYLRKLEWRMRWVILGVEVVAWLLLLVLGWFWGWTYVLLYATGKRSVPWMMCAIHAGAMVNARCRSLYTRGFEPALIVAIRTNKVETVAVLLAHGADPQCTSTEGIDSIELALKTGTPEIFDLVYRADRRPPSKASLLYQAVSYRQYLIVEYLLNHGASANAVATDRSRRTMMWCTDDPLTASALLEHGAVADSRAPDGSTPLLAAVRRGESKNTVQLVRVLLEHGADPCARNNAGDTPLDIARAQQKGQFLQLMAAAMRGGK